MTQNVALNNYLKCLPMPERRATLKKLREGLHVSSAVITNWRQGTTVIHPLFYDKIIEILGVDLMANVKE